MADIILPLCPFVCRLLSATGFIRYSPVAPFAAVMREMFGVHQALNARGDGSDDYLKDKGGKAWGVNGPLGTDRGLFETVLNDAECFEAFKKFAARDFTTENPVFYQHYRALMIKVRAT
ncbi:hypothetical protein HK104_007808, partial [Borealophlyctis nickersoniae]